MMMSVLIMWYVIVLCWPVGWLAKCHTKRCLELQDNAGGCMTFIGMAKLVLVAICLPICLGFTNMS